MNKKINQKKPQAPQKKSSPGKAPEAETTEPNQEKRRAFPVVGIGASAGGLEPLETFFAHMPTDKPPPRTWPSWSFST